MWLFTRYGFFSFACAFRNDGAGPGIDPDLMMIRARTKSHLERLQARFPLIAECSILLTRSADYRYRIIVSKEDCAKLVSELVREQDWSNFKEEAKRFGGSGNAPYVDALRKVWTVMYQLQQDEPAQPE